MRRGVGGKLYTPTTVLPLLLALITIVGVNRAIRVVGMACSCGGLGTDGGERAKVLAVKF